MRHLVVASLTAAGLSVGLTAAASAADVGRPAPVYTKAPVPVPFSWTGFYIGANAGGHWSKDDHSAFVSENNNFTAASVAHLNADAPVSLSPTGFAGGVHAGYNWQWSSLVLGVEGDFDGLTGSKTRTLSDPFLGAANPTVFVDSAQDRWMATARARAGFAVDRALFYATGGAAWSNWSISHSFSLPAPPSINGTDNSTFTRTGWTAGGGFEYAFTNNWLARVEYLYADFGAVDGTLATKLVFPPFVFVTNFAERDRLTEQVVRAGISYKFR